MSIWGILLSWPNMVSTFSKSLSNSGNFSQKTQMVFDGPKLAGEVAGSGKSKYERRFVRGTPVTVCG